MKNILGLGTGAACLALLVCASTANATVIIDNTGAATAGIENNTAAQEFTMQTANGLLSSVTLSLVAGGSGTVSVYTTSGGAIGAQLYSLGAISGGGLQTISGGNNLLIGGTVYAIVLQNVVNGWNFTTAAATVNSGASMNTGMFIGPTFAGPIGGDFLQMSLNVSPVPEVPVTGAVMGFGVLAVAIGTHMRRKVSAPAAV